MLTKILSKPELPASRGRGAIKPRERHLGAASSLLLMVCLAILVPAYASADTSALAKRIEALEPDQVLQVYEELRKEGVTEASTPDFERRFEKKIARLPASLAPAPAPAAPDQAPAAALGSAEKRLCVLNPEKCARTYVLGIYAERSAKRYGKLHNGKGDAFKHAYWSGLMAYYQGDSWATAFGNAHEKRPKNPAIEKRMDLHNNSVGRWHGVRARLPTSIDNGVDRSFRRGELKRISCGTKSSDYLVSTDRRGDYCR